MKEQKLIEDKGIENGIKELKETVLKFHRTASELDIVVQRLEKIASRITEKDRERFLDFIQSEYNVRNDIKFGSGYTDIDAREEYVWKTFMEVVKRGS